MGWRCYQKGWSYLRLGLDDDISTQNGLLLSAQRPAPRPLPQLPPGAISRLVQANSSDPVPHHFVLGTCASPTSSISSSYSSLCLRLGTLPPTLSTSDYGSALPSPWFNPCQAAIMSLVIAKHNGFFHQLSRLMIASAPSSRPSCNHIRIQWNSLSHFLHDVHGESRSTKPMRANSHPPLPTTPNPSRPESMFIPLHSIRYSKVLPLTPSSTSPFSPPLANGKVGASCRITHHRPSQRSSAFRPLHPLLSRHWIW